MSEAGKQIIRSRTKSFRDIYVAQQENKQLKEELEKAKAAAKKTLKTEPDAEQEEGDDNGNGTDN